MKPLTKENIFYHYLPLFGVKSYLELSLNIFNPNLSANIYRRSVSLQSLFQTDNLEIIFRIGFPDLTTTNTVSAAACLGIDKRFKDIDIMTRITISSISPDQH